MIDAIKKYAGGFAAIITVLSFCAFYFVAKAHPDYYAENYANIAGLYFVGIAFSIFVFSLVLYIEYFNHVFLSTLYALCSSFFLLLLLFSFADWLFNDTLSMSGVFISIQLAAILSLLNIIIRWIYNFFY